MDVILSHREVSIYLSNYPKQEWEGVILNTLLYGIYSIIALHESPISALEIKNKVDQFSQVPRPKSRVPSIRTELTKIKQDLSKIEDKLETPKKDYTSLIYPNWWLALGELDGKQPSTPNHPRKPLPFKQTSKVAALRPAKTERKIDKAVEADFSSSLATSRSYQTESSRLNSSRNIHARYQPPKYPIYEPTLKSSPSGQYSIYSRPSDEF